MKVKIKYLAWNYVDNKKLKFEKIVDGIVIKETNKQIVIQEISSGSYITINKYKIISMKKINKEES